VTWLSTRVGIGAIWAAMCSLMGFGSWGGGGWGAADGLFEVPRYWLTSDRPMNRRLTTTRIPVEMEEIEPSLIGGAFDTFISVSIE
jgi:hypothetical protein